MMNALTAVPADTCGRAPVLLMVSGGSDSTALLVRAAAGELDLRGCGPCARGEEGPVDPARLHVLHVNHCLRGADSDGDEEFVAGLAARLGTACTCRRVDVGALVRAGGNMEQTARLVRYGLAWELACDLAAAGGFAPEAVRVAVAHTADDRAETFLMRAATGAGLGGMCGMRRSRGVVVRPLLDLTRAELRADLRARGVGWREDATNDEDDALRSYVRHRVAAPLTARNPSFARTLGATLDVLSDEDDLLDRLASRALDGARRPEACASGVLALDAAALANCEPALARRALRRALAELAGEEAFRDARFEARHVEALLGLVRAGAGSCSLPGRVDARVAAGTLALALRGPGSGDGEADVELPVPGRAVWGAVLLEARVHPLPPGADARAAARVLAAERAGRGLVEGRDFVFVDAAALGLGSSPRADPGPAGALLVGAPRPGERMRPFGMVGTKLVSDLLAEARVPARARCRVPVVRGRYVARADAGPASPAPRSRADAPGAAGLSAGSLGCVWVGGIRLDARAAYGLETRVLVELAVMRNLAEGGQR